MNKTISVGDRYLDTVNDEYVVVDKVEDGEVHLVYERDGERDIWDIDKLKEFHEFFTLVERGNLVVKVKALHEDAIIPEYKTSGSAGFDIRIIEDIVVPANKIILGDPTGNWSLKLPNDNHVIVGTGLAFEIPHGYELEIRSRSGLAFNCQIMAYNGTIDSDYRAEVKLLISNFGKKDLRFKKGDRLAQGVIKKIEQVDFVQVSELTDTERGEGGFGHTGLS